MKTCYKFIYFFIILNLVLFMICSKSYATSIPINSIESYLSESVQPEESCTDAESDDAINDEDASNDDIIDDADDTIGDDNLDEDIGDDGDDLDQSLGSSSDDEDIDDGEYDDSEDDEDAENDDGSISISSQQPDSSSYNLPKTGISSTLIISMLLISLFGIYSFYKFSNQDF